jgi:cell division protein FtsL
MDHQGKRPDQVEFSEKVAAASFIAIIVILSILIIVNNF